MNTLALWSNILAFAVLSSSTALSLIIRIRRRHPWFDWYIVYAGCYALWAVMYALHFFFFTYVIDPPQAYSVVTVYVRLGISGCIILAMPMMIRGFLRETRPQQWLQYAGIACAIIFTSLGLMTRVLTAYWFSALINVLYNSILGGLSVYGLVSARRSKERSAKHMAPPFFIVSLCFYSAASVLGLLMMVGDFSSSTVSSFAVSAYCAPWALTMLAVQAQYLIGGPRAEGIPGSFITDYALTPRETEVIALVARGKSNAEIADVQCVSLKTIETHLYNVYRKTEVRNRVELINRIEVYRSHGSS